MEKAALHRPPGLQARRWAGVVAAPDDASVSEVPSAVPVAAKTIRPLDANSRINAGRTNAATTISEGVS